MGLSPYDFMDDVDPGISNTRVVNTSNGSGKKQETASLKVLIDYLSFTFKADHINIDDVLDWFHFFLNIKPSNFKAGKRFYQGYADSLRFENMTIWYNGNDNQGIHVDFTGQGCRYIDLQFQMLQIHAKENISNDRYFLMSWDDLLRYLYYVDDINITRLDIAADDYKGYIDIYKLFHKSLNGELTMKFRGWRPNGNFNSNGKTNGLTLEYGSVHSDLQLTIYEKNKQLGIKKHWTRLELQFRRDYATNCVKKILESDHDIGIIFSGYLKYYLTFRDKEKDKNKSRWPVSKFWDDLLKDIEPLKLSSGMPDRSIIKNRDWVDKQVSRTLARLYFAYDGLDKNWLRDIIEEGLSKLNDEDLTLVEEYRRIFKEKKSKPKEIDSDLIINHD